MSPPVRALASRIPPSPRLIPVRALAAGAQAAPAPMTKAQRDAMYGQNNPNAPQKTSAQSQAQAEAKQRQQADINYQRAEKQKRYARQAVDDMYTQVAEKLLLPSVANPFGKATA